MGYKNFNVAIYCTVNNLNAISDIHAFENSFRLIEKSIHVNKVYLETYRSGEYISKDKLLTLKEFFEKRGIKVSGGITTTDSNHNEEYGFNSMCYTNELHRERLKSIVEMTASVFDEIILDDFYFTNCKCESCVKAKGSLSWMQFRTALMKEVSESLVVGHAKHIDPGINMIIKYPNWYECYQETGYNLADEPHIFDMIYTGTETRDPQYTQQHLPKYLSYFLMRYLENVKPGKNGGGWFDQFDCGANPNYYIDQAYLTLFSKPAEVTLFCLGTLLSKNGSIYVQLAGDAFDEADKFLGALGKPVGTACYIPYHSDGEDYLHNYIGMLGIPLEPFPQYPEGSRKIFLTESAAADSDIIEKVSGSLIQGSDVIITSGFVKALYGKGFEYLANIRWTGSKALVDKYGTSKSGLDFGSSAASSKAILLPWLAYATNDAWQLAYGLGDDINLPVVLAVNYGKGHLYVITIPDDFGGLYSYPKEILALIRSIFNDKSHVTLDAASKIALFTYANDTFIIKSFLPYAETVRIIADRPKAKLLDVEIGIETCGISENDRTVFEAALKPSEYKVFKLK
jgi:hypothetical protein